MRRIRLILFATAVALCSKAIGQQILPPINLHRHANSPEDNDWDRVRKSDDVYRLRAFQARYPNGRYRAQVERRIAQLEKEARARGEVVNEVSATAPESRLAVVDDPKLRGAVVRVLPATESAEKK
jgi:hypothetical protein